MLFKGTKYVAQPKSWIVEIYIDCKFKMEVAECAISQHWETGLCMLCQFAMSMPFLHQVFEA